MANILIVYSSYEVPLRPAIQHHLYSFRQLKDHHFYYWNVGFRSSPAFLKSVKFDVVILHTTFLSGIRWSPVVYERQIGVVRRIRELEAVKVALPQDEFYKTDQLAELFNELGVQLIFSVMPPGEWPKIYHKIDRTKTKILPVLTGYIDRDIIRKIQLMEKNIKLRTIDVGYRAWHAQPWLGRHGMIKTNIAQLFLREAPKWGLTVDISTNDQDTFTGDEWFRFLLRCKYTIGVEGGASILDKDGSLRAKTDAYIKDHPGATFEEIEASCFPGLDGQAMLVAISPRHLEACITRTCQILVEGEYNGILKPGLHYIALKKDFSNIDEVLRLVKEDRLREEITMRAYRDIVESGRYHYHSFSRLVVEQSLELVDKLAPSRPFWWWIASLQERLSWVMVWGRQELRRVYYQLVYHKPPP